MTDLNGHQDQLAMVGGQESARLLLHLAELLRSPAAAGLVRDSDLVLARVRGVLAVHGIGA